MPELPSSCAPPNVDRASFKILVVDDNVDSAISMAMLLRMSGNDTRIAHDGEAALQMADGFRPDLILLDIGLPKLDGYEVARRIRAQEWGKPMHLIAVTGWGQDEDRRNTAAAGFDVHMVKPVNLESLEQLLLRLRRPAGADAR